MKSDPPPKTLSTRIEELYLGLLRVFILVVLAASLVGAVVLGYQAYASLDDSAPQQAIVASVQTPASDRFVLQLRKEATDSARFVSAPGAVAEQKLPSEAKGDAVDGLLNRQVAAVNEFLTLFGRSMAGAAMFKDRQRAWADELMAAGAITDKLAFAKGQSEFLDRVLKDKSTVEAVRRKVEQNPIYLEEFIGKMLDYYPNLVRDERKARLTGEREEAGRATSARAGSALQLYAAAGLFVVFLVICLILVLLKIERNLRTRGDVIQVVS